MDKYTLINYFDVWGNAETGWEINNQCVEFDDLCITDDATEKDILSYLKSIGFLSTSDRRKVCLVDYAADVIEICAKKGMRPLGALHRNA